MKLSKFSQWLMIALVSFIFIISHRHEGVLAEVPRSYKDLQFPPLPEITLPDYERYQLKNGMVVYLMEDHQLPLVSGSAIIRTGSRFEPGNQVGLASLTGSLMRLGGTTNHPPDKLNSILEQKAAAIETSFEVTAGNASFSALSYDLNTILPLFAEVIQSPAFDEQQFELQKTRVRGGILRRNDNPGDIARREFFKLIYGQNSPYGRTIELTTLDNIQREDLINFYRTYVRPENMILGIVGDFDSQRMKESIEKLFGDWRVTTSAPTLEIATPQQETMKGIFIADQPQLTQSNILLGHLGGKLKDPNYPTLSVINGILNGFGGRLYNEIRSRQGLAYSVYGVWNANFDYPGVFLAGGQTKSDTTTQFIKSTIEQIEKLRTEAIGEEELDYGKNSILNSFVFKFQNPSQTLSRLMTYEYYDYPQDFIFTYQKQVKNTTSEDILKVANEYLTPDKIVTLVVGNKENISQDLESLKQPIKTVDISIPTPNS